MTAVPSRLSVRSNAASSAGSWTAPTTILFLRDRERPGKPLVTIEMNGNQIVQIHGYQNDAGQAVKPMVRYADILDPWLAWLAAGSKRNEDGTPRVPRQKAADGKIQARTA